MKKVGILSLIILKTVTYCDGNKIRPNCDKQIRMDKRSYVHLIQIIEDDSKLCQRPLS